MEEHYTGCQHSMPIVPNDPIQFFNVSQYTSDIIEVSCCMNSTISTSFLSQKKVAFSFLAGRKRLFKLFQLVWLICVHPGLLLLFGSTFTNETQVTSPVTHTI
jgi:hypothetical protein